MKLLPRSARGAARDRGARAGRGAAADALLAADRLRALRPPLHDGRAQARRRAGPEGGRLRARLQGAGARGQQGPGREAAAGVEDDGPPPPVLHAGTGRRRLGGCLGGAFLGGRGEEHPNGQFSAIYPAAIRARYGVRNATAIGRRAARGRLTAMVMNHYKQQKRFYVRTKLWYTTERARRSTRRRSATAATSPTAWPTTSRAAASPARRTSTARPGRCRSTRASSAPARTITAAPRTRRWSSKTCNRTLFDARAYYGAGRPPVQHDPPDPARAGPDRQRYVRDGAGHPDQRRRGARAHRRPRQLDAARGRDGLLGPQPRPRRHRHAVRAAAHGRARGHQAGPLRPRGALCLRPRGAAALRSRTGAWKAFSGTAVPIGDQFFKPAKLTARVGSRSPGASPASSRTA